MLIFKKSDKSLGDFLCIWIPNTGQLNPLFHTYAEFRPIVNRVVVQQSTDWLAAYVQLSPNVSIRLKNICATVNHPE